MAFSLHFDDSALVAQLRNGDESAYSKLYEKYAKKIYNISRKMFVSHEDAEGIVQEVFLKIWRNREHLDSSLSFNSYLLTIVRSLIFKQSRKRARQVAYEAYAISYLSEGSNESEDYIIFSNLEEVSTKVLEALPGKQKQIFMMKNVEHLTIEEIAEKLNLSKRTVENQIYRATKSLKARLVEMQVLSLALFLLVG